jgi:hypothetical protein
MGVTITAATILEKIKKKKFKSVRFELTCEIRHAF